MQQKDRWAATFFIDLINQLNSDGRTEEAEKIVSAFEIFHNFASNVHVPGRYYDASSADGKLTDTIFGVANTYKKVNDTTVSVPCVPLAMILRQVIRTFKQKNQNEEQGINENISDNRPAANNEL